MAVVMIGECGSVVLIGGCDMIMIVKWLCHDRWVGSVVMIIGIGRTPSHGSDN